jgi:L-lactate dehydrogenase (cytochrome)
MQAVNIEDLRRRAQRRLPKSVFDYMDGGAWDEVTLRANRADFERIRFRPRVLVDVETCAMQTELFGRALRLPLLLGPVGMSGVFARRGEVQAARAAEAAGLGYCLSNMSICSIEEVRRSTTRPFWFQLMVHKDRAHAERLVQRAADSGCSALVLMADTQMTGHRERDTRNGFVAPMRITLGGALDTARRVRWIVDVLLGPRLEFGNMVGFGGEGAGVLAVGQRIRRFQDLTLSWKDVDWLRGIWKGPLLIKGILTKEDAALAVEHGADGVIVSNHGGRQLDGAPSTIAALPAIARAIKGRAKVLFDGGIRRGQDIVKAMALGADACVLGRAYAYGLAADGQSGVARAIEILEDEMRATLALLGRRGLAELDASVVVEPDAPYFLT